MLIKQLGLIGCGLIGGSFALALKKAKLVKRVVGYSKSPSTTKKALELGVIDDEAMSALQAVSGSDVVLLAIPVSATEKILHSIKFLLTEKILVMDVGSTKGEVVQVAEKTLGNLKSIFVPAHPIAGKEAAGVIHAESGLFQKAQVILTPLESNPTNKVNLAKRIWEGIGSQVKITTASEHDLTFAMVSHFPHVLAFSTMLNIINQNNAEKLSLAGSGFRDFTRIAASDPTIWRDICLSNNEEILKQIQSFKLSLKDFEVALKNKDFNKLQNLITRASKTRSTCNFENKADFS